MPAGRKRCYVQDDPWHLPNGPLQFVDLFSSVGCTSFAAKCCGFDVVLGIDKDSGHSKLRDGLMRAVFELNFPAAVFSNLELGPATEPELLRLIAQTSRKDRLWLHMSPPCHDLSVCRRGATQADRNRGIATLCWCFDLVLKIQPAHFSIEEVVTPQVEAVFMQYADKHPTVFGCSKLQFIEWGEPCSRLRMIATRPDVLRQLEMLKVPERTTLREHLASRMQLPKGAEYITDMTNDPGLMKETKLSGALSSCSGDVRRLKYRSRDGKVQKFISLDTVGPCVTTNNPWLLAGLSSCFEPLHAITGDEVMSMINVDFFKRSDGMLFEFKWPESDDESTVLKRYAAGNAIPGLFARALFQSAIMAERFHHAYVQ